MHTLYLLGTTKNTHEMMESSSIPKLEGHIFDWIFAHTHLRYYVVSGLAKQLRHIKCQRYE